MPMEKGKGIDITIKVKHLDPETGEFSAFDLTDVTTKDIYVKPPDGIGVGYDATVIGDPTLGVLRYKTADKTIVVIAGETDQIWKAWAHVIDPTHDVETYPFTFPVNKIPATS